MGKVMTIHLLQTLRYNGGLVRVVRVDIISERSPPLWQSYRPVLWQPLVFSICLVFSSVRGFPGFNTIESWPAYFFLHLHDGHVTLAGVNFTLTPEAIS